MRFPVPPELLDHARTYTGPPVEPRVAVTVALLRPGRRSTELLLLRRRAELSFAPGFDVFPGGKVDPHDYGPVPWHGPGAEQWAAVLGVGQEEARALVVAAVRETFEETGLLLASQSDGSIFQFGEEALAEARGALESGGASLADLLHRHHLTLRADLLGPWGRWVTPEFEPRRFDTHFLVAVAPSDVSTTPPPEAESARWVALSDLRRQIASGAVNMLPPTKTTCQELSEVSTSALPEAAWTRRSQMRTAKLVREGEDFFLDVPAVE